MNVNLQRLMPESKILLVAGLCYFLYGCGLIVPHIHDSTKVATDKPQLVSIDSKQRMILSNPIYYPHIDNSRETNGVPEGSDKSTKSNNTNKQDTRYESYAKIRLCAEPAPDVFTAIAQSFGLDASLTKSVTDATLAAKIASSLSENAATIERTQTINVLREMMYRNCERYMNDAMSDTDFIVQSARDQRLVLDLLAIEQITGVAKAQSTALTTVAKAIASSDPAPLAAALQAAKTDLSTKKSAVTVAASVAKTASEKVDKNKVSCDKTVRQESADGKDTDAIKADKKDADTKCNALDATKLGEKTAQEYYDTQLALAKRARSINVEANGALATAALSGTKPSETIAKIVYDIVKLNNEFAEMEMMCIALMRTRELSSTTKTMQNCHDLMENKIKNIIVIENKQLVQKMMLQAKPIEGK